MSKNIGRFPWYNIARDCLKTRGVLLCQVPWSHDIFCQRKSHNNSTARHESFLTFNLHLNKLSRLLIQGLNAFISDIPEVRLKSGEDGVAERRNDPRLYRVRVTFFSVFLGYLINACRCSYFRFARVKSLLLRQGAKDKCKPLFEKSN